MLSRKIFGMWLLMVAIMVVSPLGGTAAAVSDISGHWAKDSIEQAVNKGYVSGYPDGTFQPNNHVTRAEFIKMVTDALKLPHSMGGSPWYQPYVAAALEFEILLDSDFTDYAAPISRIEIMRILSRGLATEAVYEVYLKAFSGLYNGDIPYIDYRDIEGEDVRHVAMVIGSGLVSGYPDFSLGLKKTATRAEAVVMIENFLKTRVKSPEVFRGLLELKEVADTGTNAKTVSQLVPSKNFKKEPISIEAPLYTAKIKRAYVLPNEGEFSIFDRKMLWDRVGHEQSRIDATPYFVLLAYEVDVKQRFFFNMLGFISYVDSQAYMPINGVSDKRATDMFDYHNASVVQEHSEYFEKGQKYEVFTQSQYIKRHYNNSLGMYLTNATGKDEQSFTVFTSEYKPIGW